MKRLSTYLFSSLLLLFMGMPKFLSAQHLCFTTKVSIDKTDALFMVYAQTAYTTQSDDKLENPYTLAAFNTKVGFDGSKMDFVSVDYNPKLWEAVFADPNPNIERGKGKKASKNSSVYFSAVDFKPSSETTITKLTLLYTACFKSKSGKGSSIKQKDFRLIESELDSTTNQAADAMIAYSTYTGEEYPIQTCTASKTEKQEEDTADIISYFAPNPACDRVQLRTKAIPTEATNETAHFMLYDLNGVAKIHEQKLVKNGALLEWDIHLESVPQGLYIALLQIGQERYERKLVVMPCAEEQDVPTNTKVVNQN